VKDILVVLKKNIDILVVFEENIVNLSFIAAERSRNQRAKTLSIVQCQKKSTFLGGRRDKSSLDKRKRDMRKNSADKS